MSKEKQWYHICRKKKLRPYLCLLCSLCGLDSLDVLLTEEEAEEIKQKLKMEQS